jgi:dolichyl-phosphate-mannose-protein mannosyltransferase
MKAKGAGMHRIIRLWKNHRLFALILAGSLVARGTLSLLSGHEYDIDVFVQWMQNSVSEGFADFYLHYQADGAWPNYPPVSMIALNSLAYALHYVFGVDLEAQNAASLGFFIKSISNVADAIAGVAIYAFMLSIGKKREGLALSAAVLLNPGSLLTSAVWGQIDAIYSLFLLLFVIATSTKRYAAGGIAMAMALLSKVQAVVGLPLAAVMFLLAPAKEKIRSLYGAILGAAVPLLPYAFTPAMEVIWRAYSTAVGQQNSVSRFGFNVWWIFYGHASTSMSGTDVVLPPFSAREVGVALFACSIVVTLAAYACARAKAKNQFENFIAISTAAAMLAWSFFVWNTEVHERFLFPFCSLGAVFLLRTRAYKIIYWSISILFALNVYALLRYDPSNTWPFDILPHLPAAIGLAQVALLITVHILQIRDDIIPFFARKRSLRESLRTLFAIRA